MADKKKKSKKGGAKFLPFGKYFLILLVLVAQGVLAYQVVDKNYGTVYKFFDEVTAPEQGVYPMEELIVNPAGSNGHRFLVVELSLELYNMKHTELIEKNREKIKHNMLEVLSKRTVNELTQFSEREELRSELAQVTNEAIGARSVRNLYYTRYVMQ